MRALLRASSAASSSSIQAARSASSAESIEDGSRAEQSRGRRAAAPWCAEAVGDRRPRGAVGNGRPTGRGRRSGTGARLRWAKGGGRKLGIEAWRLAAHARASEGVASRVARGLGHCSCWLRGRKRLTGTPFFSPKTEPGRLPRLDPVLAPPMAPSIGRCTVHISTCRSLEHLLSYHMNKQNCKFQPCMQKCQTTGPYQYHALHGYKL
jgi:hypothetical protein